jgi:hypothetical protein
VAAKTQGAKPLILPHLVTHAELFEEALVRSPVGACGGACGRAGALGGRFEGWEELLAPECCCGVKSDTLRRSKRSNL